MTTLASPASPPARTSAASGSFQTIDPSTAKAWLDAGEAVLIDVREPVEYQAERIDGARLFALSTLEPRKVAEQIANAGTRKIIVHCKAGVRGNSAAATLAKSGLLGEVYNVAGGLQAWKQAGLPTVVDATAPKIIDVQRQTQMVIGLGVLSGVLLGALVNPWFLAISGFMGCGLLFAGSTGLCPLATMIARMPWNRGRSCPK